MERRRYRPGLREIYADLLSRAKSSGDDQARTLSHGARVAVRVRPAGDGGQVSGDGSEANPQHPTPNTQYQVTVTFSRPDKPLGDVELSTFIGHCGVPATARRIPPNLQNTRQGADDRTWFYVAFVYREESDRQEALL